ncbi:MAG: alpha/beta hydrolase [Xanthomonadales bacterium]|nr:hypothetical protein [Xanthomonadales bacterium]MCC6592763.1 alpha/beta hydrolase [Xanthomonadales bacterium]MCE7931236.1 alpha/beta hydrolase [Xanthomonadales bacterium PRO6]
MTPAHWPESPRKFLLDGPTGALEVAATGGRADPERIAVVCHPHPLHGGTMDNKVVTMLERTLGDLGVPTMRFNFRGVGASTGRFDEGHGEGEDLAAVVAQARAWVPGAALWLAGFSFGSYVSARMAAALDARLLVSVAPPVGRFAFRALARPPCPWIVLQGEVDEVVDPALVFDHFAGIEPAVTLLRFVDTGHFFHGKLVEMRTRLADVLREH